MSVLNDETEALACLAGAHYVKSKIIELASTGQQPLEDRVYAVKCRVKSLVSLKNKVKAKRVLRPGYSASSVTDIVGLRLLSLYSDQLNEVTRDFYNFIRMCQSSDINLFPGLEPKHAIREVVVYKSDDQSDVYDSILHWFNSLNLGDGPDGQPIVRLGKFSDPFRKYSSIHIVCDCQAHIGNSRISVPIEVQIRTVFEDVWSEIDHFLRYKWTYNKEEIGSDFQMLYVNITEQLANLKADILQAGQTSLSVRRGFEALTSAIESSKQVSLENYRVPSVFQGESREQLISEAIPSELQDEYGRLISMLDSARQRVGSPIPGAAAANVLLSDINKNMMSIAQFQKSCEKHFLSETRTFDFVLGLEQALHLLWSSAIIKEFEPWRVTQYTSFAEDALAKYRSLGDDLGLRDDPILNFRLSCAYGFLGRYLQAENAVEKAIFNSASSEIDVSPLMRVHMHKQMGFVSWNLRNEYVLMGMEDGHSDFAIHRQVEHLKKAVQFTRKGIEILMSEKVDEAVYLKQLSSLANNMLTYAWGAADLYGGLDRIEDPVFEFSDEERSEWLRLVEDEIKSDVDDLSRIGTALRAYDLLQDKEKVAHYLERTKAILAKRPRLPNSSLSIYEYVVSRVERGQC